MNVEAKRTYSRFDLDAEGEHYHLELLYKGNSAASFDMAQSGRRIKERYVADMKAEEVEAILEFYSGQETPEAVTIFKYFSHFI